jgi:uncharacterized protein (PEP-CTERM system associated)
MFVELVLARMPRLRRSALGAALALCGPGAALAQAEAPPPPQAPTPPPQAWRLEPSISTTVTATNNSRVSTTDPESDLVFDIAPKFVVRGRGANLKVDGSLSANMFVYAGGSQPNRFLPTGKLDINTMLLERWFYVDFGAIAEQVVSNPYAVRSDSSLDKINTLQYRASPYLQHSFTPTLSLLARNDNIWAKRRGDFLPTDTLRDSYVERDTFALEQRPVPFGYSLEAGRETTEYVSGNVQTVLGVTTARGVISYAFNPTFNVGLTAGTEKSKYSLSETTDQITGVRLQWFPTERSELKASVEKRYFGTGGSLQWSHRSPFVAMYLGAAREPAAIGSSFIFNTDSGDLRKLLDELFKTRYPNDSDRSLIVNRVLGSLGVPEGFGQPIEVFSDYAQLRDSINISVVFQGVNTTLTTRAYFTRATLLASDAANLPVTSALQADNRQRGLALDLSRKLSPTATIELLIDYAHIEVLGTQLAQSTSTTTARLGYNQELSPKTKATLGVRSLGSTATAASGTSTARELAAFVGLAHRF